MGNRRKKAGKSTMTISARRRSASVRRGAVLGALALAILGGVSALAACAPTQQNANTPTATAGTVVRATPSATAPRLIYQADWSHGLAGWKATPGWTVSGGVLLSDTGNDREVTSPFHPTTPDYAVEFRLQLVGVSASAATEYALSADPASGADGYTALFDHIMFSHYLFPSHPHEVIYIEPMTDQNTGTGAFQIHDFEPENHMLTYRVEVRGAQATLLIDGHVASRASSDKTPHLSAGAIHFYCTGVALRLSDFSVYAL